MHTMIASPIFTQGLLTAVLAGNMDVKRAWMTLRALGVMPTRLCELMQVFPTRERSALRMAFARYNVHMPPQASLPPRSSALSCLPPLSGQFQSGNRHAAGARVRII